ncbi:histone deacetylase [Candidatus Binatia bacterium]|nr:histone deacetylase [Candidatus Binatia bacterium]
MAATGIVIDPRYREHDTGPGHPESAERIGVLLEAVSPSAPGCVPVAARPATGDELALVHDGAYVERVAATAEHRWYAFDADTPTSPRSYEVSRLAAGGVLALVDAVMAGQVHNGFAFVRPPGHHAERDRAMGFCLFNNVAIAAEYLRRRHGLARVLVVDWDLHHGNGTQHMFERDPGVLYVSLHQYPYYPGTGAADEVGFGDGEGRTVNVPLPAGCGDDEYREAFARIVEPVAQDFAPEFVLISAGFDAHGRDPLGGMEVTEAGYRSMTTSLLRVAGATARGRCVAVLEGGYDLGAVRACAQVVVRELRAEEPAPASEPTPRSRAAPLLDRIARVQGRYWRL